MYLSLLKPNLRVARMRRDLGDCQELHRTLMAAFPQAPEEANAREHAGVLFRVEQERHCPPAILVQSRLEPDWAALPVGYLAPGEAPAVKVFDAALSNVRAGQVLRFRLRANPTRLINSKSEPDGTKRNGQRVPLRNDPPLAPTASDAQRRAWRSGEEKCLDWLARRGDGAGFRLAIVPRSPFSEDDTRHVPDVRVAVEDDLRGGRADRHLGGARRDLTISPVLFEGRLEVVDADLLRQTVAQGIGPAKAYGCGLLSLARV